jgi:two-component system KDP operon response regulator KdpE
MKQPIRILVADDHEDVRRLFLKTLQSLGYSCDTAVDGKDCLDKFRRNPYDVLFLDLIMPNVDGHEVLRQLRKEHPNAQIVVASVEDDDQVIAQILSQGANAYLVKPCAIQDIKSVMKNIESRFSATLGEDAPGAQ